MRLRADGVGFESAPLSRHAVPKIAGSMRKKGVYRSFAIPFQAEPDWRYEPMRNICQLKRMSNCRRGQGKRKAADGVPGGRVHRRDAMVANMFDVLPSHTHSHSEPRSAKSKQAVLGQFFTPSSVADFMASLFPPDTVKGGVRLLDAGAGAGALSIAFAKRWNGFGIETHAFEVDEDIRPTLAENLVALKPQIHADFLEDAAKMIRLGTGQRFTHAILNPPYRKIGTSSRERALASAVGLETVNLYSAFVGLALELMTPGGQLVAIIPRSFCNGPYYRPFRRWIFQRAALRQIHLFHSRKDAFSGDDVLQENVIIHLERQGRQQDVIVSTSTGSDFADLETKTFSFNEIVHADDPAEFIHIPTDGPAKLGTGLTLSELGFSVATGPVVAFRLKDSLRQEQQQGTVPLLWPHHLKASGVTWPLGDKKPNAIAVDSQSRRWLMDKGWYVIVKRFSSKEERRRIVATLVDPNKLPGEMVGIENKLNVIHFRRGSLSEDAARGLAAYLNTSKVDHEFRQFSGHTQVNAADLRRLLFPSMEELIALGRRSKL